MRDMGLNDDRCSRIEFLLPARQHNPAGSGGEVEKFVSAFGVLGVLVATPLVAILRIVHNELFRKRFLPTVTDADLNRLAEIALDEKQFVGK
jgi:hypothetical protein